MIPVSREKNTPPEKKALGKIGFQSTKSGAGEQFLPLDCMATGRVKGMCFSQTPVPNLIGVICRIRGGSYPVGYAIIVFQCLFTFPVSGVMFQKSAK